MVGSGIRRKVRHREIKSGKNKVKTVQNTKQIHWEPRDIEQRK